MRCGAVFLPPELAPPHPEDQWKLIISAWLTSKLTPLISPSLTSLGQRLGCRYVQPCPAFRMRAGDAPGLHTKCSTHQATSPAPLVLFLSDFI